MCINCTNFTHVPFAQYLHHLMLCQCVEGNVKSTELSLKVVFYLSPSSALFREQCRFEWLGFDGSNIQRKHGARPKTIEANFWGEAIVPAHYLMGQKDPRHYRVSFWALVRNDLNKNCKVFQHFFILTAFQQYFLPVLSRSRWVEHKYLVLVEHLGQSSVFTK